MPDGGDRPRPARTATRAKARGTRAARAADDGLDEAAAPTPLQQLHQGAGNRATAKAFAPPGPLQREPAPPGPTTTPTTTATTTATTATTAATTGGPIAPGSTPGAAPQLFPIWDRRQKKRIEVDAVEYEAERVRLQRLLTYFAREIPADAKNVLESYPYPEIEDLYKDVMEDLQTAGHHYSKGNLAAAGYLAGGAIRYTDFEVKAHKRFEEESVFSYVGKRVGMAAIGFFQGAADSLLGLVDAGAGLVGFHPGLVEWNEKRYDQIKEGFGDLAGIDHKYVHDDEIGHFGGKIAGTLATGKYMGGMGTAGKVILGVQAAAGVKGAVTTIMDLRSKGKSWTQIATDPVAIASVAGAVAGAAGVAAPWAKTLGATKEMFESVGLAATGTQLAAFSGQLIKLELDTSISDEERMNRRFDIVHDIVTTVVSTADDRMSGHGNEGATEGGTEKSATSEGGAGAAGTEHAVTEPLSLPDVTGSTPEVAVPTPDAAVSTPDAAVSTPDVTTSSPDAVLELPGTSAPEAAAPVAEPQVGRPLSPGELLENHGIPRSSAEGFQAVSDSFDVVIKVRSTNLDSLPTLAAGGAAKPEIIKVKTLQPVDAALGGPSGREGQPALFEPKLPADIDSLPAAEAAAIRKRYAERQGEWEHRADYDPYLADGRLVWEDGLLKVSDPRVADPANPEQGATRDVGGDHDVYDITHADGSPLTDVQRTLIYSVLRGMGINVEHGFQKAWQKDSPQTYKPEVDAKLQAGANAEGVVAFGPKQQPLAVPGDAPVTTAARTPGPGDRFTPLRNAGEAAPGGPGSEPGGASASEGAVPENAVPSPDAGDPADLSVGDEHSWIEEPTQPDAEIPLDEGDIVEVWTRSSMEDILAGTDTGRAALAAGEQMKVGTREGTEKGSEAAFGPPEGRPDGGEVIIGGANTPLEAAISYVHEIAHAEAEASGQVPDAASTPVDEYVTARLAEEAHAQARSIRMKHELEAAASSSVPVSVAGESIYVDAYNAALADMTARAPDIDPVLLQKTATVAAEAELAKAFADGRITPSTTSLSYAEFYRQMWQRKQKP